MQKMFWIGFYSSRFWFFFHPFFLNGVLVPFPRFFGFLDEKMLRNVFLGSYTLQPSTESKGVSGFEKVYAGYCLPLNFSYGKYEHSNTG